MNRDERNQLIQVWVSLITTLLVAATAITTTMTWWNLRRANIAIKAQIEQMKVEESSSCMP